MTTFISPFLRTRRRTDPGLTGVPPFGWAIYPPSTEIFAIWAGVRVLVLMSERPEWIISLAGRTKEGEPKDVEATFSSIMALFRSNEYLRRAKLDEVMERLAFSDDYFRNLIELCRSQRHYGVRMLIRRVKQGPSFDPRSVLIDPAEGFVFIIFGEHNPLHKLEFQPWIQDRPFFRASLLFRRFKTGRVELLGMDPDLRGEVWRACNRPTRKLEEQDRCMVEYLRYIASRFITHPHAWHHVGLLLPSPELMKGAT